MLIPRAVDLQEVSPQPESAVDEIQIQSLLPNPFQPRQRFSQEEQDELADSIRTHGILQPLVVRRVGDKYQCVVGERRLRAATAAGLTTVPALVRDLTDQEMLALAVVENAQRQDLSPLESAAAYKRLTEEFGMTQQEVAAAIGKSRSAVANTLRLLDLPDPIREALASGELTEGHARALLTAGEVGAMLAVWDRIAGTDVSVREVERLARDLRAPAPDEPSRTPRTRTPSPGLDPNLAMVVERLQRRIGTKVVLKPTNKGGSLMIEYYSEEDLTRIADLLLGTAEPLID
jgi:ParB family chromosome partitioning protein